MRFDLDTRHLVLGAQRISLYIKATLSRTVAILDFCAGIISAELA